MTGQNITKYVQSMSFDIIQEGSQNWIGKVKVWKTDTISLVVGRRQHGSAEGQWAAGDEIILRNCRG